MHGTSALYHNSVSSCVQRRLTYFPGQVFRCLLWVTGPSLNRILPPQEASIASAAESLRYQYPVFCTRPVGLTFSSLLSALLTLNRLRAEGIPSGQPPVGLSWLPDSSIHQAAEIAGSKANAAYDRLSFSGEQRPTVNDLIAFWPSDADIR